MGIRDFFWKSGSQNKSKEISCKELLELYQAAEDYQVRKLAFQVCTNMIANSVSACTFRTFEGGVEKRGKEHYLWNVSPNLYQNQKAFINKLIWSLYTQNESLVVMERESKKPTNKVLLVADSWTVPELTALTSRRYENVAVDDLALNKVFKERDVFHFELNYADIKPVIASLCDSYSKLIQASVKCFNWQSGQHWKVHVDQIAQGEEGWEKTFQNMMTEQFKPFINSDGAVLPEFNGYLYENAALKDGRATSGTTRDIRALVDDVFVFTARAIGIPPVLVTGEIADIKDATARYMTHCIDPLCENLQKEITRKYYSYDEWANGDYLKIDTSTATHLALLDNASNIEKLVGSGYSYNDIQRLVGGSEINEPWAEEHFITKNFESASAFVGAAKGGEK